MQGGLMAGIEIANAYVALTTKMPGVKSEIEQAVGGPEAQAAADSSGKSLGQKLTGAMGGVVKAGAAAVGAVAAGLAGTAIAKGFARLSGLDQAQAKLRGLGHDAGSVKEIMNNALASVRGTAFGMAEAGTAAANAVASGVKPGKDLERTLKLVADTATIAGTGMGEMGAIFNKVAASNKVQMDVINQLHDAGVPALALLAKQLGVTAEQASKMASAGKIDFKTFQDAMEKGLGGAALSSGETFTGAMANVGAALGRIGANVMGGFFPQLAPLFQATTSAMEPLEAKAKAIGEALGGSVNPVIEKLVGWLGQIGKAGESVSVGLSPIMGIIGPLIGAFAALAAGGLGGLIAALPGLSALGPVFSTLGGPVGLLIGALAGLIAVSQPLQDALGQVGQALQVGLSSAIETLRPAMEQLMPVISQLVQVLGATLAQAIQTVVPIILPLITMFANLAAEIIPMLIPIIMMLAAGIHQIASAVMPLVEALLTALMPVFQSLMPVITDLISAFLPLISAVLEPLIGVVVALLPALMPLINAFISLLPPILSLISPLMDLLMLIIPPLTTFITILANIISTVLTGAFNFLIPVLMSVVDTVKGYLMPIIQMLQGYFEGLIQFITGVFSGNWSKAWGGIVKIFSSIWDGIVGIAKGVLNSVINTINGLIGGINGVAGMVSDATGGAINLKIPTIPKLAQGGVITARPGGMLATIGEGRDDEAVIPLNQKFYDSLSAGAAPMQMPSELVVRDVDGALVGRMKVEANQGAQRMVDSIYRDASLGFRR